jgi:hypothetical protein
MKRKFKQQWSTIPPISAIQTITFHLLTEHKKTMTYYVGNRKIGIILKQAKNVLFKIKITVKAFKYV